MKKTRPSRPRSRPHRPPSTVHPAIPLHHGNHSMPDVTRSFFFDGQRWRAIIRAIILISASFRSDMALFTKFRKPAPFLLLASALLLTGCLSTPNRSTGATPSQQFGNGFVTPNATTSPAPPPAPARPPAPAPPPAPAADVPYPAPFRAPADAPTIRAKSWILLDAGTGRTLAFQDVDTQRAVASTQKLLTALVVLDRGGLDQMITIRPEDTRVEPTKMYLKPGQRYSRRQLLSVFLVKSANDAALALARDHSGSIPAFAAAMNRKARQLGAYRSVFKNPHGLTEPGQHSTARDIGRIACAAYRNSFIRSITNQQRFTLKSAYGVHTYANTNKLLGRMSGCNGMKTGYTQASGRCLISSASRSGRDVILVQLGTQTKYIWDDGEKLMNWGLQRARVLEGAAETGATARLAGHIAAAAP